MSIPSGNPLLQVSPFASDGGAVIGRDPRDVPPADWRGNPFLVGLKAIRAKCLDCAFDAKEVRKCVQTDCPLWPIRMGSVPRGFSLARQEADFPDTGAPHPTLPGSREAEKSRAPRARNDAEGAI